MPRVQWRGGSGGLGSTSAIWRIADYGGIEHPDGSFLHQRTHTPGPEETFAIPTHRRQVTGGEQGGEQAFRKPALKPVLAQPTVRVLPMAAIRRVGFGTLRMCTSRIWFGADLPGLSQSALESRPDPWLGNHATYS